MGGLAGIVGAHARRGRGLLDRMLRAPVARGARVRRAPSLDLAAYGEHDVDLAWDTDRGEAVAIAGYVRTRRGPCGAARLLAALRAKGESILDDLTGEFAFAARVSGRTFVVRDAIGTRPMYVAALPGGAYAFGTSLFAMLYAGVGDAIDRDAVTRSLVLGYPTAPATALASVRQLGPGEMRDLEPAGRPKAWFIPRETIARSRSLAASVRAVDRAVTRAVCDAIPQDGRVSAFLSGGIDSSIVLARLHEAGANVEAYTLYFGDDVPAEIRYARAVAAHLGVRHHVLHVTPARFRDAVAPAARALEDVLSEAIAIPNFLLAAEASRAADAIFTGEGGDQSFGGPKNVAMAIAFAYATHPAAPPLASTYLSLHRYYFGSLAAALEPEALAAFDEDRLARDVGDRFFGGPVPRDGTFVGRVMLGNTVIKGGSNILPKASKGIGFANDVALRSPMYDRRLVALALTIPPSFKLDGLDEKLVLRRAALRSLPAWVVDRPKRGMTLPIGYWFARDLGALARDVLTERAVRDRGLLRWDFVERLLGHTAPSRRPERGRALDQLWLALMTELHLQAIDAVARDARTTNRETKSVVNGRVTDA